jgi:flagellar protein FliJ
MPKFIFHLEGVLRQRTTAMEMRQRELAVVQTQMTALDSQLRALDASMRATERDMRENRLIGKLDLAFLAAHRRYAIDMHRRALAIARKMAEVQVHIDQAKRNLVEASKQKKIIEKLRERQFHKWRHALDRREAAEMDEIGTQLSYVELAQTEMAHTDPRAS